MGSHCESLHCRYHPNPIPNSFHQRKIQPPSLRHREPCHAHYHVQPPLLTTGILERPHAIAVDIPESPRGRVHTALTGVAGRCRLVHETLLDDGTVDGEAEWRRSVWCRWSSGFNERLKDVVLRRGWLC